MNCMNCGAFLADKDLDYCPHCGCNVLIQKKVEYLSKLYYNQGLEKASIRDLSGAVNIKIFRPEKSEIPSYRLPEKDLWQ